MSSENPKKRGAVYTLDHYDLKQVADIKRFRDKFPHLKPTDILNHDVDGALLRVISELNAGKKLDDIMVVLGKRKDPVDSSYDDPQDFAFQVRSQLVLRIKEALDKEGGELDEEIRKEVESANEHANNNWGTEHIFNELILLRDQIADPRFKELTLIQFHQIVIYIRHVLEKKLREYEKFAQIVTNGGEC